MKTQIQQTSIEAYASIQDGLSKRQQEVLTVLTVCGAQSNREISVCLNLPINCVTGRVNELVDSGVIFEKYKVKDTITNRTVIRWAVVPTNKQNRNPMGGSANKQTVRTFMKVIERRPFNDLTLTVEYHFKIREDAMNYKLSKEMKKKGYKLLDICRESIKVESRYVKSRNPEVSTYYRIAQLL